MTTQAANRRLRLLLLFFAVVFGAVLTRALWLQGVRAGALGRLAQEQHRETVTVTPARGAIYDRSGVQLAVGEGATTVYADPRLVRNAQTVAGAAATTLQLDENALLSSLGDRTRAFVYVDRKADPDRAKRLAARHLSGLGFYREERRGDL